MSTDITAFLKNLNLKSINDGACAGPGRWLSNKDAELLESINPTTEICIAQVRLCTAHEYETVITAAHNAFLTWRSVPAPKRGEVVRQIGQALREKKQLLGSLISLEMGKSKAEGDGEVQEMIDMADFAVGQARMLYGLSMHSERPQHRMYEQWHPYGIVGIISAFNFPVAVWAWNAFIAAIAGDTVVWKPSMKTPLCAIAVQHICNQVMEENGYSGIFNLFLSDNNVVREHFISDSRIPLISFTGSTPVGRHVHEVVSRRLGRSLLEMSGNNAIIVDESADLALATRALVFGAVGTSGQRCTTTRRLIVHESIYQSLLAALIKAYQQIKIGDPLQADIHMGPLVDSTAVDNFQQAITAIKKAGGDILYGGHVLDRPGYFVEPTIARAQNHWDIVQQETFAPILYVITYKDFSEAIALQNNVPQGLSSALFTLNLKHAEQFLAATGSDCGIANINIGTSGAEIGGAFGGEKETGGGREAGSDIWKNYMRRQTNTINWGDSLPLAQGIEFN
ncbi:aldehyde dehydrogenase family protein [soil metagenome]